MKSKGFLVFVLMIVLAFFAGSANAQAADRDQMVQGAEKAGVAIYPDQMVSVSNDGGSVTAATLRGYEQVPPANLAKGTDVGFIHLDAPKSGIPAGFYRLHASADPADVRVGKFEATVDLVDENGKVVATVPATADASSLEVPSPLPFERTAVRASISSGQTNEPQSIIIIIICPNGVIIIIWLPFWWW
jgi:hypothetical protein